MPDKLVLKKNDVIMIETASPLPDLLVEEILKKLKAQFPNNEVFMPNGAKVTIVSVE